MNRLIVLGLLVVSGAGLTVKPTLQVAPGAKALTPLEKARVSGKSADWKLPKADPQPPGRFPSGNPQLKPSK